jgi:hypothetical protein
MPDYKYTAIDRNGAQTSGKIEATNDEQARQKLMAKGLMVTTLANDAGSAKPAAAQAAPAKAGFTFGSKVSQNDVTIMTRQLATLIVAGLPLLRALELITKQERNPAFKAILGVRKKIAESGTKTIFNVLGPLINPAQPAYMLVGVYDVRWVEPLAAALQELGVKRGLVTHTTAGGGMDEVTTAGPVRVRGCGELAHIDATWLPGDFGFTQCTIVSMLERLAVPQTCLRTRILEQQKLL